MKKITTLLLAVLLSFSLFLCTACVEKEEKPPTPPGDQSQTSTSGSDGNKEFQVVFFDMENSADGTVHYYGSDDNTYVPKTTGVKPADCYMIKTGNTEILVDAGFQFVGNNGQAYQDRIAKIYQQSVLQRLKAYCSDGVLEYLIVTHGDYDHIAGLAVDGGLLDHFASSDEQTLDLKYVIDFDSEKVVFLSKNNWITDESNLFLTTEIGNKYRTKRDNLVKNCNVKHIPASEFFKTQDIEENTFFNAMSDNRKELYDKAPAGSYQSYVELFYTFAKNEDGQGIVKYSSFGREMTTEYERKYKDLNIDIGQLKTEGEEESTRYYYSIPLENSTELQILYNWEYDHFYRHSIDSQDRNNISVCFAVTNGNKKFVSFGDLGGNGEGGVINYYKDTDLLKDVTCFKASHHGSTSNDENSAQLFKLMTPESVVVTGVAQINRDILATNDPMYSLLDGTATMKKKFFDNIKQGDEDTEVYCMQVATLVDSETSNLNFSVISKPFYGELIVEIKKRSSSIKSGFKGEVDAYVSSAKDELKHFKFSNCDGNDVLPFQQTLLYQALYGDATQKQNAD